MKTKILLTGCFIILHLSFSLSSHAQGTAFTYQGRLNDGANLANGTYDLRFGIFDALAVGTQQGSLLTNSATVVSNGLFTVTLDFGNQFPGANRWLEIGVRTNGAANFFTLSPRQALTPAPYAITAGNVISGGLASGTYGNAVTFNNANNSFNGSFSGNGANVTNVNAVTLGGLSSSNFWNTAGNSGTAPGANFVGTTDNQPLEFRVNGQRGLRLEPVMNGSNFSNDVNVIGGSAVNFVAPGISGATISGGGAGSYFGARVTNSTASDFTVIAGGASITIQTNALYSTIGGGHLNTIQNQATESTIGGGANNAVQSSANDSTISGGNLNVVQGSSAQSTIGGGYNNTIQPLAPYSTIGGGGINTIQNGAYDSAVGAGYNNTIRTNSHDSVIGGGLFNLIRANYATIGGGVSNSVFEPGSTVAGGQRNSNSGIASIIGGGDGNTVIVNGDYSTIGGGQSNQITIFADHSIIGGGQQNVVADNADHASIGGGEFNLINPSSPNSTIGGGVGNQCEGNSATIAGGSLNAAVDYSFVGGGSYNHADGTNSAVLGGYENTAYGSYSAILGGFANEASGVASLAAGTFTLAAYDGDFVWADYSSQGGYQFASTGPNQFLIYAVGGVGIGLNNPSAALHVASASGSPQFQITQKNTSDYSRLRMGVSGYPTWEMDVSPGATPGISWWTGSLRMNLDYNGNLTTSGTVNGTSDRNAKEKFTPVSSSTVLDKVAALPITEWNFKNESAIRHIGPMAQDFYAAFSVGMDDKHIATVDEGGVALAAIQGLNQKLESENAELKRRLEVLEKIVLNEKSK